MSNPGTGDATRAQKVNWLLQQGPDDARRLDLDRIDEQARTTHTWGSSEHRNARDQRERAYDAQRTSFEKLSDQQLDDAYVRAHEHPRA